jgi:2,3-bisphosphoglycerate-independent phosphoglycerate mutase
LEAPDEMGHEGNAEGKIQAIESFDEKIAGIILNNIEDFGDYRILVFSDHPTPLDLKTHAIDPSPFAVLSSRKEENKAMGLPFNENAAKESGILVSPGYLLMEKFIKDWKIFVSS